MFSINLFQIKRKDYTSLLHNYRKFIFLYVCNLCILVNTRLTANYSAEISKRKLSDFQRIKMHANAKWKQVQYFQPAE